MWKTLLMLGILFVVSRNSALALTEKVSKEKQGIVRPKTSDLKENEVFIFWNDQYIKKQFLKIDQVELSADCQVKKNCEAFRVSQSKFPLRPPPHSGMINPGAQYCRSMGGKAYIGISKNNHEVDLCHFPDGSFLKSWGAYLKHYPIKEIRAQ